MPGIHMYNPQILGVPNAEQQARIDAGENLTLIWQGEMLQIPANMRDNPVGFANGLSLGIPGVRVFRQAFNTYSFGDDGLFHPQMQSFMLQMAANGCKPMFVLMDGPSQESGNSDTLIQHWPGSYSEMTGLQDWVNLMPRLAARHSEAWNKLLNWLEMFPQVEVAGFEAINEPASYGRAAGRFPSEASFFVETYADHVKTIFDIVSANYPDIPFFVGGWNYSATFDIFEQTYSPTKNKTILQFFKDTIGERLYWSIHLYPQWGPGTLSIESQASWLENRFRPILGDKATITEMNAQDSSANAWRLNNDDKRSTYMFVRNSGWLVKQGWGVGYWPVVNYAAGYMFFIRGTGQIRQRQRNSYSAGLGWFAAGNHPDIFANRPVSGYSPVTVIPTDETLNISEDWASPDNPQYADVSSFAYGFGGAGICVINGDAESGNYLYGGDGRNIIYGGNHDDHLFSGRGGAVIRTGRGNNNVVINGGASRVYTGAGWNQISLFRGATELILDPSGNHFVIGFDPSKGDRVSFKGSFTNSNELLIASITQSSASGKPNETDLIINLPEGGKVTFFNGSRFIDTLFRFNLDFISGWYAPGWSEPVDFTEDQFDDPIVPPTDPTPEYFRPKNKQGIFIDIKNKAGVIVPPKLKL